MSGRDAAFPGESRGPDRRWGLGPGFRRGTVALTLCLALATSAVADSNMPAAAMSDTQLADPAKEAQAKALMETIRCLVCQGQSIADSNAELAGDMRSLIRQRIQAGETPESIRAWLVRRYGNWVTYEPPLDRMTFALWAAPVLFLLLGIVVAGGTLRRRRR